MSKTEAAISKLQEAGASYIAAQHDALREVWAASSFQSPGPAMVGAYHDCNCSALAQ